MIKRFYLCATIVLISSVAYSQENNAYGDYVKKANDFFDAKQYAQSAEAFGYCL